MKVLIGMESSGVIRDAFIRGGHDAMSCDLLPTESPGPHYQGDIFDVIDYPWDLAVFHPECTHISVSGAAHFAAKRMDGRQQAAVAFFMRIVRRSEHIPKVAIENPVCIMSRLYRKPDCIVQPYQHGHDASKATCLWLKGLPPLEETLFIDPHYACKCGGDRFDYSLGAFGCPNCCGDYGPAKPVWQNQTSSGQNRLPPSDDRWRERSKTYSGIGEAMARQWGGK